MKVLSIVGTTKTGKTTVAENVIKELKRRGYSVGSVKEIHYEAFKIDTEGTNTDRHKKAGANPVTALGMSETDIMHNKKMDIYDLLRFYDNDYVILEGVKDGNFPTITTAKDSGSLIIYPHTFLISGIIANSDYKNPDIPVMNILTDIEKIVDLILKIVPPIMPDYDMKCCNKCSYGCRGLLDRILKNQAVFEDCKINEGKRITLNIGGKDILMNDFVSKILENNIKAVIKELEGYRENLDISINLTV